MKQENLKRATELNRILESINFDITIAESTNRIIIGKADTSSGFQGSYHLRIHKLKYDEQLIIDVTKTLVLKSLYQAKTDVINEIKELD